MSNDRYRRGGREGSRENRRSVRGGDDPRGNDTRDPEQVERDVKQRLQGEETLIPVGPGGASGTGTQSGPGGGRHTLEYGGDSRHPDDHASQPEAAEEFASQAEQPPAGQSESTGSQRERYGRGRRASRERQPSPERRPSPQQSHQGTPAKQPHQQPDRGDRQQSGQDVRQQPDQDVRQQSDRGVQLPYSEQLEEAQRMTERGPNSDQSRTDTRSSWQERSQLGTESHESQRREGQQSGGGRQNQQSRNQPRQHSRYLHGRQQGRAGREGSERRRDPRQGSQQGGERGSRQSRLGAFEEGTGEREQERGENSRSGSR